MEHGVAGEKYSTARDIARVVPRCPSCGSRCYRSLTENTRDGFRLKALRCDRCNCDILAQAIQLNDARREPASASLIFGGLTILILLELFALLGLMWS